RIEIAPADRDKFPDGISCRDATIELQDKAIDRLTARVQALEEALKVLLSAVRQYKDAVKQRHERHDFKGDVQLYFQSAEQNLEDYESVAHAALAGKEAQ